MPSEASCSGSRTTALSASTPRTPPTRHCVSRHKPLICGVPGRSWMSFLLSSGAVILACHLYPDQSDSPPERRREPFFRHPREHPGPIPPLLRCKQREGAGRTTTQVRPNRPHTPLDGGRDVFSDCQHRDETTDRLGGSHRLRKIVVAIARETMTRSSTLPWWFSRPGVISHRALLLIPGDTETASILFSQRRTILARPPSEAEAVVKSCCVLAQPVADGRRPAKDYG